MDANVKANYTLQSLLCFQQLTKRGCKETSILDQVLLLGPLSNLHASFRNALWSFNLNHQYISSFSSIKACFLTCLNIKQPFDTHLLLMLTLDKDTFQNLNFLCKVKEKAIASQVQSHSDLTLITAFSPASNP